MQESLLKLNAQTDRSQKQTPSRQSEETRSTCLSESGVRNSESFAKSSQQSPMTKEEEIQEFRVFLKKYVNEQEVERMASEISNNWSKYEGTLLQQSQRRHQRAGDRSLKLI